MTKTKKQLRIEAVERLMHSELKHNTFCQDIVAALVGRGGGTMAIVERICELLADDEYYMPLSLPVDADGVPIRFDDLVYEDDDCSPVRVMSLTYYDDYVEVNACRMNPNNLHHVKPRTVEDVLRECAKAYASGEDILIGSTHELFAKYAAELRMRNDND